MSAGSLPTFPSNSPSPKPPLPHYTAFERLVGDIGDDPAQQLRALVAFGLYVEAECRWVKNEGVGPKPARLLQFHTAASTSEALEKLRKEAESLIANFSASVVQRHQEEWMTKAVHDAVRAVENSSRSYWTGVKEAISGAFFILFF